MLKGLLHIISFQFQLASVPSDYNQVYLELSRRGARVLALAWKELGRFTQSQARDLKREELEKDLTFAGFVIISCPLKTDSRRVITEIQNASHKVRKQHCSFTCWLLFYISALLLCTLSGCDDNRRQSFNCMPCG